MILRSTTAVAFLVNVHPDRIRDWARRGLIHPETHDDLGRPRYDMALVLDVANGMPRGRTWDDYWLTRHGRRRWVA